MRIEGRPFGAIAAPATRRGESASGSFTLRETAEAGSAASARAAAPLATLGALLALQEEDDPRERRRRSTRRGQEILDALDGLKAALLAGTVPPEQLRRVAAGLARAAGPSGDPGLDEVIAFIEMRAKIELAKLGRL